MAGIHPTASQGFVRPDVYEQGRPDYPIQAVEALGVGPGTSVLDLGCGTGKLTRLLDRRARIVGVDPLPRMASSFRALVPHVPLLLGRAEDIPLRGASCDVVVCASAFHWFDHDRAVPEIRRVLREGGKLRIIWNRRDELGGWAEDFWRITEAHRRGTPSYRTAEWRQALDRSVLFGPIEEDRFSHVQHLDAEGLIARVASISFIQTLEPALRDQVIAESMEFIRDHPDTRDLEEFELPYRTVVYSCTAN